MARRAKVICPACNKKNEPHAKVCGKCGLSLTARGQEEAERKITCPRCGSINNAASFFCYTCGKYFADVEPTKKSKLWSGRKKNALLPSTPEAKVIMPGGTEMTLTGEPVFIERSDLNGKLSQDILMKVSRQHILITFDRGKYYVKDYGRDGRGSTNHTKLNGIDIYNKRKKALKDGDKIELAGQPELTLTFKLSVAKK